MEGRDFNYHLMIKFPIEYEVGEVRGDQVAARECYIAMLEMDDHLQTMNIEVQRAAAELVEGLEEILLDNSRPKRMIRIGILASSSSAHSIPKRKSRRFCLEL